MQRKFPFQYWIIAGLFFAATVYLSSSRNPLKPGAGKFLSPPPEHIEQFHFGFRDSIADSLWLRWIQDSDTCQTYKGVASSAATIPQATDERFFSPRHKVCDNSWAFKMLDAVTKLAPGFEMPYLAGAMSLSVAVEDYDGASVIFDRGVQNFPNDWQLLYRASYHFLFDRQDITKAASLLLRAADHGAPEWTRFLAARLYSKSGQIELGIATLENYLKSVEDPEQRAAVELRLAELKKQAATYR